MYFLKKLMGALLIGVALLLISSMVIQFEMLAEQFVVLSKLFSSDVEGYEKGYAIGTFMVYAAFILVAILLFKYGLRFLRSPRMD